MTQSSKKVQMAFLQTFLLLGPNGFKKTVQFDTASFSDKAKTYRDVLFQAHLNGHTVNLTADSDPDGPAIRNVQIAEVHSKFYEVKEKISDAQS